MNPIAITHATLKKWQQDNKPFHLIDIREQQERELKHMGGLWLPLSSLLENIDSIPTGDVVLYCRSGARSMAAATKLREILQREDIFTLDGGMLAAE